MRCGVFRAREEPPGHIHETTAKERGGQIDDAGAAEPLCLALAEDVEAKLSVWRDVHMVDRALRAAHAALDVAALERGAAGGGGGEKAVARIADGDLAVRAEIDRKVHARLRYAEQHGRRVRADELAEQRQKLHERARRAVLQSNLSGGDAHGVRRDACKRLRAERGRIDAEKEVLHCAVAAENELPEIVRRPRHRGGSRGEKAVDRVENGAVERGKPVLVLDGVLDAGDHVRAVADLAVERRAGVQQRASREIVDIHRNGRCADVHGSAEKARRRIAVLPRTKRR